jgi:hypothetical protein
MTALTEADLDRLSAICDAATDGPWEVGAFGKVWGPVSDAGTEEQVDGVVAVAERDVDGEIEINGWGDFEREAAEANARFIAEARTALPALVEEVRRLRKLKSHSRPTGSATVFLCDPSRCNMCNGRGWLHARVCGDDSPTHPCSDCNGTGRIEPIRPRSVPICVACRGTGTGPSPAMKPCEVCGGYGK